MLPLLQQAGDGEELNPGILPVREIGGDIEARLGGFRPHRLSGFDEGNKQAHLRLFALHDTHQVADHGDVEMLSALDRHHDLFGGDRRAGIGSLDIGHDPAGALLGPCGVRSVEEIEHSIHPGIGPLLPAQVRLGVDQGTGPPLELVLVPPGQRPGTGRVLRRAMDLELDAGEGILHPFLDQGHGQVGNVDPDPLPA